ncbi:MAG TPA: class I SAM-dependent methyltransferase [Acidimicrobiales bacterium]|jgi:SAM-dependent methyltransferase
MSEWDQEWHRRFYGLDYYESVRDKLSEERTVAEVEWLTRVTNSQPPNRIVDVPCGFGRHVAVFGSLGYLVTGVDLNPEFIAAARARCQRMYGVELHVGDMRRALPGPYELCLSLYHSFGYFDDRENAAQLRDWTSQLTRGGHMVVDVWNADLIHAAFRPDHSWKTPGGLRIDEHRTLDRSTSRLRIDYVYTYPDGRTSSQVAWFRLYRAAELEDLAWQAGLIVDGIYGSLRGEPHAPTSTSTVVVCRRP